MTHINILQGQRMEPRAIAQYINIDIDTHTHTHTHTHSHTHTQQNNFPKGCRFSKQSLNALNDPGIRNFNLLHLTYNLAVKVRHSQRQLYDMYV